MHLIIGAKYINRKTPKLNLTMSDLRCAYTQLQSNGTVLLKTEKFIKKKELFLRKLAWILSLEKK